MMEREKLLGPILPGGGGGPRKELHWCLRSRERTCDKWAFLLLVVGAVTTVLTTNYFFPQGRPTIRCSGNGHDYGYGCICRMCFAGPLCSEFVSNCTVDVRSGDPYMMEEFWTSKVEKFGLHPFSVAANFGNPYDYALNSIYGTDDNRGLGGALNQKIRSLHNKFKNLHIGNKDLIYGSGGTQLLVAALYAYSQKLGRPFILFVKPPYYADYPYFCKVVTGCIFSTSFALTDMESVVEIVTHPNNPDGSPRVPFYNTSMLIYDMVYFWPHLSPSVNMTRKEVPISIWSISKFAGLAGTRFGWAFVENDEIASYMTEYIYRTSIHTSVDSTLRVINTINLILDPDGDFLVATIKNILVDRWTKLGEILDNRNLPFRIAGTRMTWYLWVQCKDTSIPCGDQLANYGILGWDGSNYGTPGFARMQLICYSYIFDLMIAKFRAIPELKTTTDTGTTIVADDDDE